MADFGLGSDLFDILDSLDYTNLVSKTKSVIELKTDYPYLIFERDDLVKVLNLCSKLIQSKSTSDLYNSITLVPVKNSKSLYFYVTNALSHFRYRTELLGDLTEILDEEISISISILQKIVRLMGDKVLIYKKDGYYFVRLIDGDLQIYIKPLASNLIFFPGEPVDKIGDLKLKDFGFIVNSILPLLDIKTNTNKICFFGDKVYFHSPYYYIESTIETPEIYLSYKDSEFISRLYKYYPDSFIQLFSVDTALQRLFIKLDNIEYEFINSKYNIPESILNTISSNLKPVEFAVDFEKFYRIINLATSLPHTQNIARLVYLGDNKLGLSILVDNIYSDFTVDIVETYVDKITNLDVKVRTDILKRLLVSLDNIDKLKISISELCITIEYDNIKAALMTYNV